MRSKLVLALERPRLMHGKYGSYIDLNRHILNSASHSGVRALSKLPLYNVLGMKSSWSCPQH